MVQEALGNAAKHAGAKRALVSISASDGELHVAIRDDGHGFDLDHAKGKGLGLISMEERVRHLGGAFSIAAKPGHGTRIEIRLPLETTPVAPAAEGSTPSRRRRLLLADDHNILLEGLKALLAPEFEVVATAGNGWEVRSPISPLLSNLHMRRFVLGWKTLGHEKRLGAYIVNYADDLVICCRSRAEEALATMRIMMTKLRLTVNETKTRVAKLPEEKFDFLGYTFGRCYSPKTGRAYLGTTPAKKRVIRICQAISSETGRNKILLDHKTVVTKLNQMMNGWANYFCLGPVGKAYRAVDQHARGRLRQWLRAKHKSSKASTGNLSIACLHDKFGLIRLTQRTNGFSWAKP